MNGTLIYAESEIQWFPLDMESFDTEDREGKTFIKANTCWPVQVPRNVNPLANSKFWEEVANGWYPAFRDKNRYRVEGYYRKYGFLAPPLDRKRRREETWEGNLEALDWFNLLTSIFDKLEAGNVGLLKDLFGEPRKLKTLGGQILLKESDVPLYSIAWKPEHPGWQRKNGGWFIDLDLELPTPQADEQYFAAAWNVVIGEVQKLLNLIPLAPATEGEWDKRNLTWRFKGVGAFEAAFLQWYFQKIAPFETDKSELMKCARSDCNKVFKRQSISRGSPQVYCSNSCRWTENSRKRRERERKKSA